MSSIVQSFRFIFYCLWRSYRELNSNQLTTQCNLHICIKIQVSSYRKSYHLDWWRSAQLDSTAEEQQLLRNKWTTNTDTIKISETVRVISKFLFKNIVLFLNGEMLIHLVKFFLLVHWYMDMYYVCTWPLQIAGQTL